MLLLGASCSDADHEIPLDRAEQSSTHEDFIASRALDDDLTLMSHTQQENYAWLRVYFKSSSTVEKVLVKKSWVYIPGCVWTVSVYDREAESVCGTYTDKPKG